MNVLVTGAAGRLGRALMDVLARRGHSTTGLSRGALDVAQFAATRAALQALAPEVVVHTAAWTDVDGCARDPQQAYRVNGLGAGNVAQAAAELGAVVVHISTNEVFDGTARRPYREDDAAHPANPYGASKWAGEQAVRAATPRHMIVRTAWVFAHGGRNFLQAILAAAAAGKPLRVVTDEVANPTYNDDLADGVAALLEVGRWGTYHLTNSGSASRWALARYALDRAGHADVALGRISRASWPRPSTPPAYAALENVAAASVGVGLRPWPEAVDAFLRQEGLYVSG